MSDPVIDPTAAQPESGAAVEPAAAVIAAASVPATPQVPEKYEFAFPENTLLDKDGTAKRLTERLKSLQVADAKLAQSYVDATHEEVSATMQAYVAAHRPDGAAFKQMVDRFTADALAAPDLGNGDPLQLERKTLNAKTVLSRYEAKAPKAVERLTQTGMIHDPEVLRLLNAVYEATKEPGSPAGSTATLDAPTGWSALFPNGVPEFTGESKAPTP